ncbi:MAG TPA: hypothetical protein P5513_00600 [Candidatus Diapherotrites archaeon]|nr:hypothetical protein [Candidatus Diapherotrites archaeon]
MSTDNKLNSDFYMVHSVNQRYNMTRMHHISRLKKEISEGRVDVQVIPFLLKVSELPDIFTASSCAGRIILLSTNKYEDKKISTFYKRYHRKITFSELKDDLQKSTQKEIWFKVEPFIFHFGTKDFDKAKEILCLAQQMGLKKTGIISVTQGKYIVEVNSTQYLSLPLKVNGKTIVTDMFLKIIVNRANTKLTQNYARLTLFEKKFLNKFGRSKK